MKLRLAASLLLALLATGCATGPGNKSLDRDKQAQLHYQLGIDALNKGLLPKAFEELMESDKLHANQPQVLDALAYAWRLRGDLAKSEEFYRKALRAGPLSATHNNYASLLLQLKRYSEAEREARKALEDPRYPNQNLAFLNLGDALLEQGKFNEAIEAYQQASLFRNWDPLPKVKEAQAYMRYGRENQARAILQDALHKAPDNRLVVETMVKLMKSLHDLPRARLVLENFRQATNNKLDRAWASDEIESLDRE